jgi:hypothetical protein
MTMLRINWSARRPKNVPENVPATVYARPKMSQR